MRIGSILFTYHRSEHTRKVIEALSKNDILPEKLYIFQDGIKASTNYDEWLKVNELIQNIDWCKTEVNISADNKGIAKSVVEGVNYVLQECDAVIVLEDDCVPHKQFMRFMVSALNAYHEEERVYCVSGYAWNVTLPCRKEDAYFNGRSCSYGWGTWKDRWSQYEEDYRILTKIKKDPTANQRLQIWGQDLAGMVVGNVLDKCDAWDVFWSLKIIEKGGYCLSPYRQMVHNIGCDGSGVHCGQLQENPVIWEDETKESFFFPSEIEIDGECEKEFRFLFPGRGADEKLALYQNVLVQWIQKKQRGEDIKIPKAWGTEIAVWGKNKIAECLINEIEDKVLIKYIIESRPSVEKYKERLVVSIDKLPHNIKTILVIPYYDLDIIKIKVKSIRPDILLCGINELFKE